MKTRHWLMLAGLIVAAWFAFFGDKSADTELVAPVVRRSPTPALMAAQAGGSAIGSQTPLEASSQSGDAQSPHGGNEARILALRPRSDLAAAGGEPGEGGLFSGTTWTPPPPPKPEKPEPPPAPVAPPLPFVYLGKQVSDGHIEVFLARGDEVLVVRDQTVIQNTYRVESIGLQALSLVYLPLGQVQQLSIGVIN